MKYLLLLLFSFSVSAIEYIVEMKKMRFVPDNITIELGDTVRFINKSKYIHNVVVKKLKIKTKYVRKNKIVMIKPNKIGKFDYYCQPHRRMGMTGVIEVKR